MKIRLAGIKSLQIGHVVSAAIVYVSVPYGNRFTMSTNVVNITYEGDNTTQEVFSSADLSGTMGADKLDDAVILAVFTKTAVFSSANTSLSSKILKRIYFGEDAEATPNPVELLATAIGVNETAVPEEAVIVKLRVFQATIDPFKPGDLANRAKVPFEMNWKAKKTTKDINSVALPGVPTDGATYSMDIMISSETS